MRDVSEYTDLLHGLSSAFVVVRATSEYSEELRWSLADIVHDVPAKIASGEEADVIAAYMIRRAADHNLENFVRKLFRLDLGT